MDGKQIVKYFGGEMQAAIAVGKSHQTIKNWVAGTTIPNVTQEFIELMSHGKLKADKVAK